MTINKLRTLIIELSQSIPTHPDWRLQTTPKVGLNDNKFRTLYMKWKSDVGSVILLNVKVESVFKAARTLPTFGNGVWSAPRYIFTAGVEIPKPGWTSPSYQSPATLDQLELKTMIAEWLEKSPLGVPIRLAMRDVP